MTAARLIAWNHPNLGRIHEVVCAAHEEKILNALHTLGIGCQAQTVDTRQTGPCYRCTFPTTAPRDLLEAFGDAP